MKSKQHGCHTQVQVPPEAWKNSRALLWAVILSFGYGLIEFGAGLYSHSLALISDAGHMFTDAVALLLAWFANWFSQRPPSKRHSYGFARIEVIAAALNALFMLFVIVWILIEAFERLYQPVEVEGGLVFVVALIGLLLNLLIAFSLSGHQGAGDLNTRAALVHVMGDLFGSIAALVSGVVIVFTGWTVADPLLSILVSFLVLHSVWGLLKESFLVLMEGVPVHIDLGDVEGALLGIQSVQRVTDLHVWNVSSGYVALSAHILIDTLEEWMHVSAQIEALLKQQFKITHITIQPEVHR